MKTTFILNGEKRTFNFEPNETLADSLRDIAGMKSVKIGCNRGDCGTCTIIMNGDAVKSCLILASEAEGLQRAFSIENRDKAALTSRG